MSPVVNLPDGPITLSGHGAEFGIRTKGMAAVVFTVESVWDQTPRPASAGVRIA